MEPDNYKKISKVLLVIFFGNLLVAAVKILIGTLIKSVSMTADGFHSITDSSSNIVGLIGIRFAFKPVDEDHPYGHRKFETLSGLFIAGMLFMIGGKIVLDTIKRLLNPITPDISIQSIFLLVITIFINTFICIFEYKRGRSLNSQILVADSMHTRSDIHVSISVLATLICIKLGLPPIIDLIVSFIISGFVFYASYEVFIFSSNILVDKVAVDTEKIKAVALGFSEVKDTHKIRSRGNGNDLFIDMHIMTEPNMSVKESHELTHNIEKQMQIEINSNIQFIAHLEPFE